MLFRSLEDDEYEADCRAWETKLRPLFGRRTQVSYREVMDWAQRETVVPPEWGLRVTVLPDEAAGYVEEVDVFRKRLLEATRRSPGDALAHSDPSAMARWREEVMEALAAEVRFCWGGLLALEEVTRWVADDLDGEDPLMPELREELVRARVLVEELRDGLVRRGGDCVLPDEPDAEMVEVLKDRIANASIDAGVTPRPAC